MRKAIKKTACILLCLILAVGLLSGCSGNNELNPSKLADKIKEQTAFSQLKNLSGADLASHFHFKDSDVKSFCAMISASGESADTIACFELRDDEDQELVVSGITQYLANRIVALKATMVNEYEKVLNRVLVRVEDTVVLVICSDYKAVTTFLDGLDTEEIV